MAVVVRNEGSNPFYFGAGSERRALPPGDSTTISEDEWAAVPISKRGAGSIRVLWPTQPNSPTQRIRIEQYVTNSVYEPRYIGTAVQSADDSDPVWTIKRLAHVPTGPTTNAVVEIQVLEDVAWDDRASLPWT